jgi:hypothetical protein
LLGTVLVLVGAYCRLNPLTLVLRGGYSYSGAVQLSAPWQYLSGFTDLMNILVATGALLIIISFTTLLKDDE